MNAFLVDRVLDASGLANCLFLGDQWPITDRENRGKRAQVPNILWLKASFDWLRKGSLKSWSPDCIFSTMSFVIETHVECM